MKIEISAGGVVYKKKRKMVKILLLKDPKARWTFPKGLIEKGEDRIETARREIAEEVGLKNTVFVSEIDKIQYFYRWNGELIKKTVYYYLFEFVGNEKPIPQEEEGIKEAKWFTPKQALKTVGYQKTNKKILEEALMIMKMR